MGVEAGWMGWRLNPAPCSTDPCITSLKGVSIVLTYVYCQSHSLVLKCKNCALQLVWRYCTASCRSSLSTRPAEFHTVCLYHVGRWSQKTFSHLASGLLDLILQWLLMAGMRFHGWSLLGRKCVVDLLPLHVCNVWVWVSGWDVVEECHNDTVIVRVCAPPDYQKPWCVLSGQVGEGRQRIFCDLSWYSSTTPAVFYFSSRGCFLCGFSFFVHAHLYICASVDMKAGPSLQPLLPSHINQALASSTGLQGESAPIIRTRVPKRTRLVYSILLWWKIVTLATQQTCKL